MQTFFIAFCAFGGIPYSKQESLNVVSAYIVGELKDSSRNKQYELITDIDLWNIYEEINELEVENLDVQELINSFYSKENPKTFSFSIKKERGNLNAAYTFGYHGRIYIPDAGVNHPIYRDGSQANVDAGNVGLLDWSGIIGVKGSTPILAAHNNRGPFGKLGNLKIGSKIYIDTFYGQFIYEVTGTEITPQYDGGYFDIGGVFVNTYAKGAGDKMVLYTCYPFNYPRSDDRRFLVFAELIEGTILE